MLEAAETGRDTYRDSSPIERGTGSNTLAGAMATSVSLSPRPQSVDPMRPRVNRDRSITVGESSRPYFYVNDSSLIGVSTTRDCMPSGLERVRTQGSHRDGSGDGDRSNTKRHSPLKVSENHNSDDSGRRRRTSNCSRPATNIRPQKSVHINGSVFHMYEPYSHRSTSTPRMSGSEWPEEVGREVSSIYASVHQPPTPVSSAAIPTFDPAPIFAGYHHHNAPSITLGDSFVPRSPPCFETKPESLEKMAATAMKSNISSPRRWTSSSFGISSSAYPTTTLYPAPVFASAETRGPQPAMTTISMQPTQPMYGNAQERNKLHYLAPPRPRTPSLTEFGNHGDHGYEDDVESGLSGSESEGAARRGPHFPTLRTTLADRKRNNNIGSSKGADGGRFNGVDARSEFIPPPSEKASDPHWIKGESGRWFLQSHDPRNQSRRHSGRGGVVSGPIQDADDSLKKLSRYNYDKQQYFDDHMQEVQGSFNPGKTKRELEQQAHRFAMMMRRTSRMASIGAKVGDEFLITFERLQPHSSSEQEQEYVINKGDTADNDNDDREEVLGKPRNQGGGVWWQSPIRPLPQPSGPLPQSTVPSSTHNSRSLQNIQTHGIFSPAPQHQTRIPASSPKPLPHGASSQPLRERKSMPARPVENCGTPISKRQSYGTSSSKGTAHRVYYENDTEIKPTSRSSYLSNKSSTTTSITRSGAKGIVLRGSGSEHQGGIGSEFVEPMPPNALVVRPDRSGNGVVFSEGSSFGREGSVHATSTMTYVEGQEEIEKCAAATSFTAAKSMTRSTMDGEAKLTSNPHIGSSKDRTGK